MKNKNNTKTLNKLRERAKELNCLYGLFKIAEQPKISLEKVLKMIVNLLPASWQYPRVTCARILYKDREFKTHNFKVTKWKLSTGIKLFGRRVGFVEIYYTKKKPKCYEGPFLKEERVLINAITRQLSKIIERKNMERTLRKSRTELWKQKTSLERKNIALQEVIGQIEVGKNNIKNEISTNVNGILLPILEKIKIKKGKSKYLNLLGYHLKKITSSFGHKITERQFKLTPREIEICSMIKGNLTSKEISTILNLSPQTIEKHRKNIRKKLRIPDKKTKLTAFLQHF